MSEQLNRIEQMLGELIRTVGNTNTAVADLKQDSISIRQELSELRQSQARMEHELTDKVRALFDVREIQHDVNERVLDSLASIQADVNYLVTKTAQHNAEISRMKRTKKAK